MLLKTDDESRAKIARHYSELANEGYFSDRKRGNETYLEGLLTKHVPETAQSITEIGPGTGLWMSHLLKKRSMIRHVTAVEISDAARGFTERIGPILEPRVGRQLNVYQGDFLTLYENDVLPTSEVVVASFTAEYMGEPGDYLQKLLSLTQPGGRVILADVLTHPDSAGSGIGLKAMIESFALICLAYFSEGKLPPLFGMAQAGEFYGLYEEESFKALNAEYHDNFQFPIEEWRRIAAKFPGSIFHNLGVAGFLVLPNTD